VTVTRADVEAAAARIAPFVDRTPVLRSDALDDWVGAATFVKAEHRQPMGAFKYRGATNAVQSLSDADAARGVCAHSSGNHAAALALAASVRGIPAYVVMPEGAPEVKRRAVEQHGGSITWCANTLDDRRRVLADVAAATGAVEIHPFDDERVIAGAGTAARELVGDVPDLDAIITPVGGGGLCSGTCIAAAPIQVHGASPVDRAASIADGLRTGCSERTAAILAAHHVEAHIVPDDEIRAAMHAVRERLGQIIEPSGAIAFAAARRLTAGRIGIISTGRNVDA
jgi:threonine dehydratase/serine racemase